MKEILSEHITVPTERNATFGGSETTYTRITNNVTNPDLDGAVRI